MKKINVLIFSILWGGVNAQVGIGTTSPSNDLDVESNSGTATAIDINNTSTGDPKINFQLSGTSTFSMGIDNSDADKFKIGTSALETSTRFTIDASGNCGIGNTAPTALLDVDGSAIFNESGAAVNFRVESDANTGMLFVDGTNNRVGIGTTSPSNVLDVESNSVTATAVDINCTGAGDPKINFQLSGTSPFSMGIDNSDSDKFKIGTSALETNTRLTIDASGNCGIGNTSPGAKLDVDGSAIFNESGAQVNFRVESDANTGMLFVDGTNNRVGIGTSSPAATLDINGNMKILAGYQFYATDANHGITFNESDKTVYREYGGLLTDGIGVRGHVFMCSGSSLQMQLATDAAYFATKLLIGTTNQSYTFAVNGQPGANGFTAFTNYSDSRLKTNISSLDTGALSKIMQLRPVSFQYNQKYLQLYPNSDLQKVHKGFIAQEIRKVFPEMVSEMKASPDSVQYLDLDVSHLQVYLVKALQEQQAIIEAQEREIDALKVNALKVANLENKMNAMLLLLNNKQELTVKQ